ncbi:MAG: hypothetical protein R6V33_06105 [Pelovirga sp.]
MTTAVTIAVTALGVAAIALVVSLCQYRSGRKLAQQLELVRQQLTESEPGEPQAASFSEHLTCAEKVQDKVASRPVAQAEKYRYAVALADQGYTVEGIAGALKMAPTEVEQVMQLARIKRPTGAGMRSSAT